MCPVLPALIPSVFSLFAGDISIKFILTKVRDDNFNDVF